MSGPLHSGYRLFQSKLLFFQFRNSGLIGQWAVGFAVDGVIKIGMAPLQFVDPWLHCHVKCLLIELMLHKTDTLNAKTIPAGLPRRP